MPFHDFSDEYLRDHPDLTDGEDHENPEYSSAIKNLTNNDSAILEYSSSSTEEKAQFIKRNYYQIWLGLSDEDIYNPEIQNLIGEFLAKNNKASHFASLNSAINEALSIKEGNDYKRDTQGYIMRLPAYEKFKGANNEMVKSLDQQAEDVTASIKRKAHTI